MAIRIYSTDTDAGQLTVVDRSADGSFQPICEIPVGNAPRGSLKMTHDGRGFVSNCGGDTISEIDLYTNREVARITVGLAPRGIGLLTGSEFALVSNSGSNFVSVVDLSKREEIARVGVGRDPRHMAVTRDGTAAYVCVWGSHYVAKLDTSPLVTDSPRPEEVREVGKIPVGHGAHPYSAAFSPNERFLVVANTQAPYVSVIDAAEDSVAKNVDVGHKGARAVAFSPDGQLAFVTIEDWSEVAAIDMESLSVTRRWPVGPGPRGIALDPTSLTIYSSSFSRGCKNRPSGVEFLHNSLTVLEVGAALESDDVDPTIAEIPVGAGPCSVALLDLARIS